MFRSTYRQGDFAALCDLFGKHSKEVQDACVARDVISETCDNRGENILPGLHLDG